MADPRVVQRLVCMMDNEHSYLLRGISKVKQEQIVGYILDNQDRAKLVLQNERLAKKPDYVVGEDVNA
jgi:hypothetical protein